MTRYAKSRQKSCQQCSKAKARCDRRASACGRCIQKGLQCSYSQVSSGRDLATEHDGELGAQRSASGMRLHSALVGNKSSYASPDVPVDNDVFEQILQPELTLDSSTLVGETLTPLTRSDLAPDAAYQGSASTIRSHLRFELVNLELICPINADEISNRWLNSYVPVPGQAAKNYSPSVSHFIRQTLKSYAAVTVRGRGVPPFLHRSQIDLLASYQALATCLSVVRICEKPISSAHAILVDVLQREMDRLYDQYGSCDAMGHLCVFQTYLIYAMVLYFHLSHGPTPSLRQAMMRLQELACASSKQGLLSAAEGRHTRPSWEAWIVTEAKRRTLYTMYLFDNLLSAEDNLPTFLGTELCGLPAPASKCLWQANEHVGWERAYNSHLAEWDGGGLRIDELWPAPADLSSDGLQTRHDRVDRWLEAVDEFGVMLYAVTSCTHGS